MSLSLFQPVDFTSPAGNQLREKLEAKKAELQEELGGLSVGNDRTQQIRGGITVINEMLAKPAQFMKGTSYGSIKRDISHMGGK